VCWAAAVFGFGGVLGRFSSFVVCRVFSSFVVFFSFFGVFVVSLLCWWWWWWRVVSAFFPSFAFLVAVSSFPSFPSWSVASFVLRLPSFRPVSVSWSVASRSGFSLLSLPPSVLSSVVFRAGGSFCGGWAVFPPSVSARFVGWFSAVSGVLPVGGGCSSGGFVAPAPVGFVCFAVL
jgi:hypothetical protein